jgi:hypothetical protein
MGALWILFLFALPIVFLLYIFKYRDPKKSKDEWERYEKSVVGNIGRFLFLIGVGGFLIVAAFLSLRDWLR